MGTARRASLLAGRYQAARLCRNPHQPACWELGVAARKSGPTSHIAVNCAIGQLLRRVGAIAAAITPVTPNCAGLHLIRTNETRMRVLQSGPS